jgi:rubrerythrin
MPIFDQIGKKIAETGQSALKGTKTFADVTRLSNLVAEEQKRMTSFYMQIGKKYYEQTFAQPEQSYAELFASVEDSMNKISELRLEILKAKEIQICPSCGAETPITSRFCSSCGYEAAKAAQDNIRRCPNCARETPDGMKFCSGCGQKMYG